MSALLAFADAHAELIAVMGEQATALRGGGAPESITVYVDDAVQDVGQFGRVVGARRVVTALNADWVFMRGDLITVRDRSAKVDEILANDGICNTAVLHG